MYVLREGAAEKGAELLNDVLSAIHDQQIEDGSWATEAGADKARREELTTRWKGTVILAQVAPDGPAAISRLGMVREEASHLEPVSFPQAAGPIKEISTANGGWITFGDNMCISLNMQGQSENFAFPATEDFDPNLKLEVFSHDTLVTLVH